ncbi:MAG TPA: hypothetical protein VGX52_08760 [Burkholderiales bacterium]|nr:hypothetical protein [Burkholderiales bacterium]
MAECELCRPGDVVFENELAYARSDSNALSRGHMLGKAGGQSRMHAHLHLIPRYAGDVPDPRGGIRCVLRS